MDSAPPPATADATRPSIIEIWTLYAIGSLMITARLFVRVKLVGFSRLHPDDFLVCLALVGFFSYPTAGVSMADRHMIPN